MEMNDNSRRAFIKKAANGVHPTLAGAQLMAQAWMKAIERFRLLLNQRT